ncbi:MAG: hypothetical protein NT049_16195, partial [Planctomycetota bacterium]|nr:hypothetical protein [Planctomycetota bacterium]
SAGGHAARRKDPLLAGGLRVRGMKAKNWVKWLLAGEDAAMVQTIRACTRTGRPAGDEAFLTRLEKLTRRTLRVGKVGRPPMDWSLAKKVRGPAAARKRKRKRS